MSEFITWFFRPDISRTFLLILFFVTYVLILLYVYTGKKRSERLESYKNIPFQDGDDETPEGKVKNDE